MTLKNKNELLGSPNVASSKNERLSTGVLGLDHVLGGGLTPQRLYLVEGNPGAGKTTLALQYFFAARSCTVFLLNDRTSESGDLHLRSVAHGHYHGKSKVFGPAVEAYA